MVNKSTNDVTTEVDGRFGNSKASRSKGKKLAKKSSGSGVCLRGRGRGCEHVRARVRADGPTGGWAGGLSI